MNDVVVVLLFFAAMVCVVLCGIRVGLVWYSASQRQVYRLVDDALGERDQ